MAFAPLRYRPSPRPGTRSIWRCLSSAIGWCSRPRQGRAGGCDVARLAALPRPGEPPPARQDQRDGTPRMRGQRRIAATFDFQFGISMVRRDDQDALALKNRLADTTEHLIDDLD